jgi:hypothetical protein
MARSRSLARGVQRPKYCDDYLSDETAPAALRVFLERARSPAQMSTDPYPKLFADYQGKRVRVTMASRFGDVGITTNLQIEDGYDVRVHVAALTNFGDKP